MCYRVKKGGPSPVSNTALAALFEKVKELDVPKEIVERNIKKASEKGQEAYIEKFYEVPFISYAIFFCMNNFYLRNLFLSPYLWLLLLEIVIEYTNGN